MAITRCDALLLFFYLYETPSNVIFLPSITILFCSAISTCSVLRGIPLFRAVHLGEAVDGRCSATLLSVCEQTHQPLFGGLYLTVLLITALPMAGQTQSHSANTPTPCFLPFRFYAPYKFTSLVIFCLFVLYLIGNILFHLRRFFFWNISRA